MLNFTPLMQRAYDLRMSGKLEPQIASEMGISTKNAFQLITRCRRMGMELPRRRSKNGTRKSDAPRVEKLPPNMPSKKIERCKDCELMLSNEGTCIDCPADRRRMLVFLTNQRSLSGTLYEVQEEAIDMGDLGAFKKGVRVMQGKYNATTGGK